MYAKLKSLEFTPCPLRYSKGHGVFSRIVQKLKGMSLLNWFVVHEKCLYTLCLGRGIILQLRFLENEVLYLISCSRVSNSGVLRDSPNVISRPSHSFFDRDCPWVLVFAVEDTFDSRLRHCRDRAELVDGYTPLLAQTSFSLPVFPRGASAFVFLAFNSATKKYFQKFPKVCHTLAKSFVYISKGRWVRWVMHECIDAMLLLW